MIIHRWIDSSTCDSIDWESFSQFDFQAFKWPYACYRSLLWEWDPILFYYSSNISHNNEMGLIWTRFGFRNFDPNIQDISKHPYILVRVKLRSPRMPPFNSHTFPFRVGMCLCFFQVSILHSTSFHPRKDTLLPILGVSCKPKLFHNNLFLSK
jgi:hypothetical protein